jgi:ureidoacrylate peracid hydrolase
MAGYRRPAEASLRIDPSTTALIVLDMQNGFAAAEGSFAKHGRNITLMRNAIPTIRKALEYCRRQGIMVIYTKQINLKEFLSAGLHSCYGREVSEWFPEKTYLCLKDTWDAEIVDELTPVRGDIVIEKNKSNIFHNTWLELWLKHRKVRTLLITGCTTGMCVLHSSMDANIREYDVILLEDGVGDQDPLIHDVVLELIDRRFGRVLPWKSVKQVLDAYPAEKHLEGYPMHPGLKHLAPKDRTYLRPPSKNRRRITLTL